MNFKRHSGDWRDAVKRLSGVIVYDFTGPNLRDDGLEPTDIGFETDVLETLADARERGARYAVFIHGRPKAGKGETTVRTYLRAMMRHQITDPDLRRGRCRQCEEAFIAALRPLARGRR